MPGKTVQSVEKMIGQMFMLGISGEYLSKEEERFISENNIGFIILFSRNTVDPVKVKKLTGRIHELGIYRPVIFVDQEGGPVVRFGEKASTFISHMGLAASGKKRYAKIAGRILGREMKSLGIDGIFAPVLDVNSRKDNPVIGIRSFSDKERIVSGFGKAFIEGLESGGVLSCPKHFPGHGDTSEDSHYTLPATDISESSLLKIHIPPFRKAVNAGVKAIMTAHVVYPSIDDEPGTFSYYILNSFLRRGLSFKGIVFSDCLEMAAIKENYSPDEIIVKAIRAGIDVLSVSHSLDFAKELIDILKKTEENNPEMAQKIEESIERVVKMKRGIKGVVPGEILLRKHLDLERKIAAHSITLVKDERSMIPLNPSENMLIINMKRAGRSTDFSVGGRSVSVKSIIGCKFDKFEILDVGDDDYPVTGKTIREKLRSVNNVVLINYSSGGKPDKKSLELIDTIISIKADLIFVAAENPFVLEFFPRIPVMIATYGSRMVQIEALFSILCGQIKPKGKLPVKLNQIPN